MQKRGQGEPWSCTSLHSQRGRETAAKGNSGRASLRGATYKAPHLTCHTFVSNAIKKGMVHDPVIRLAPVEEGQARELSETVGNSN
jgi:hypothetical protein